MTGYRIFGVEIDGLRDTKKRGPEMRVGKLFIFEIRANDIPNTGYLGIVRPPPSKWGPQKEFR